MVSKLLNNLSDEEENEYWDLRTIISNLGNEYPDVDSDMPKETKWAYDRIRVLKAKNQEIQNLRRDKLIQKLCETQRRVMTGIVAIDEIRDATC